MAKLNNISVLWIDQQATLSIDQLAAFAEQGMAVHCAASAELSEDTFVGAQVIVLNLSQCTGLLKQVQNAQIMANSTAPVIARVQRDNFELGIQAMAQGAMTVVSASQFDAREWAQTMISSEITQDKQKHAFVFADPVSRNLLALAERVAQVDVTVLLTGPTGVGKEVLARILHDASPRYDGPFIAFNCAAMPENLIEDMLFGHEKGSFTGATKVQPGLFEQAQGGTIFLDEIGEMSFHLQAKLLRILQERSVVRLGGQKAIDLDIRVIAATNRNLKNAIVQRTFREDLYFRLSAFKLTLPPLRDRPLDILPLVEQFAAQQSVDGPPVRLTSQAQQMLASYPWPGNVRELQNVILRAMVLANQAPIDTQHLIFDDMPITDEQDGSYATAPGFSTQGFSSSNFSGPASDHGLPPQQPYYADNTNSSGQAANATTGLNQAVKNSECQTIMAALQGSRSRDQAAEKLGISPRTLRHKLQKLREQGISVTRAYAR